MRQSLKTCVLVAAASGALGAGAGPVFADAGAQGGAADSPGVLSGNAVQVPVHVPVNVCGNSVDGVGLLNPAMGNRCGNGSAPGEQRAEAPARGVREAAGARGEHDPRLGAVARAGKAAGRALLASSGAEQLGLAAGAGGGLLFGGAVLLRRSRKRRG
ncbi:chaplin [Streptomyces sp. NPDC093707]|uniref:chaplin n=1 Tax=Streptomyces sp. NPDC093707 TaxID=3154984 RepID=UPI00344DA913